MFFKDKDELNRLEQELGSTVSDSGKSESSEKNIWLDGEQTVCEKDLLLLFSRNQLRNSLALPLLAVIFALSSMMWTSPVNAIAWLACVFVCQAVQLYLCKSYEHNHRNLKGIKDWVGMLAASEFLFATCWSMPLYLFWVNGNPLQHTFLIAVLMVVIAVRIMIASNYTPIIIAGTGFITLNIVIRCTLEADTLSIALGAMAILTEIFFIQLSKRLQKTAKDMLIFKAQREKLISQLETARIQAEADREKAEAATKAKSRFLATMSHELRTPLNAIMGFSEILSHEMMGPHSVEAYKSYSSDIHHSGHYLLHLINDILDLSRIEAGKHEIEDEPVDLFKVGQDAAKLLHMKLDSKHQKLASDIASNIPCLRGDERSIRQIWVNLLSNAVKFSDDGATINMGAKLLANGSLSIYVADNGPGMDKAEIKEVLGTFNRGNLASKKAIDGSGLGLPIVNGLAKLHNASMQVQSKSGAGTKVSVIFPPSRVLGEGQKTVLKTVTNATASQRQLIALTS